MSNFSRKVATVLRPTMMHLFIVHLMFFLLFAGDARTSETQKEIVGLLDAGQFEKAIELASRLAIDGSSEGQYYLGMMYINGIGKYKNIDGGIALLLKSAKQSNADALNELTNIYFSNRLLKKDEHLATLFAKRSAEQGDAVGQYNYAYSLANGIGVSKDEKKAVDLYLKSANQGNSSAQHSLGYMYFDGLGTKKNNREAEKWYRLAAQKGEALSMRALGIMHSEGDIGFKRPELKLVWFRLAKKAGLDWVQQDIARLEKELPPKLLILAEEVERKCLDSKIVDCE